MNCQRCRVPIFKFKSPQRTGYNCPRCHGHGYFCPKCVAVLSPSMAARQPDNADDLEACAVTLEKYVAELRARAVVLRGAQALNATVAFAPFAEPQEQS